MSDFHILNELNDTYRQIVEDQEKSNKKAITRQIIDLAKFLQDKVTLPGVIRYLKGEGSLIKDADMKGEGGMDAILIGFDTETTGLTTAEKKRISKRTGSEYTAPRNQIYELAAIAYDDKFKTNEITLDVKDSKGVVAKDATFHGKTMQKGLDKFNDPEKILQKIIKRANLSSADTAKVIDDLYETYKSIKVGFKLDPAGRHTLAEKMVEITDGKVDIKTASSIAFDLESMFSIFEIMGMTKYDKTEFRGLYSNTKYEVDFFAKEIALIDNFLKFIEKLSNGKPVYIMAHNMAYDQGMVQGSIESFKKYASMFKMESYYNDIKKRYDQFFGNPEFILDTKDVFKKVLVDKDRLGILRNILSEYEEVGRSVKGTTTSVKRSKAGKASLSMGPLSALFKIENIEWHTAANDVHVMMELLKTIGSLTRMLHELMKVNETGQAPPYIGKELAQFVIDKDFKTRYKSYQ